MSEQMSVRLKPADIETLRWMAEGKTAAEIAAIMFRTKWTIQKRIEKLRNETGSAKDTALVATAIREGWIS